MNRKFVNSLIELPYELIAAALRISEEELKEKIEKPMLFTIADLNILQKDFEISDKDIKILLDIN